MRSDEDRRIRNTYDRIANRYDAVDWFIPTGWRRKAAGLAYGRILEVGVGTGLNLPLYTDRCQEIFGIDVSRRMLDRAETRVSLCKASVTLAVMDIQEAPLETGRFDCVLAAFVFCTVPDPLQGLRECHRVLKPGGRLILLEHMGSDKKGLARFMTWLNPFALRFMGDHINRDTVGLVKEAGFQTKKVENLFGDVMRLVVAEK